MARKYVDCRDYPSEVKCSVAIAADNDEELLEAVVQHNVVVHHAKDTADLRKMLRSAIKEGNPPA